MEIELQKGETLIDEQFCSHMKGIEAVGGKLTLTNQRIIYKSHKFNIQNHELEIKLSDIQSVEVGKLYTYFPGKGMKIILKNEDIETFSPRNRTRLIDEINRLIQ